MRIENQITPTNAEYPDSPARARYSCITAGPEAIESTIVFVSETMKRANTARPSAHVRIQTRCCHIGAATGTRSKGLRAGVLTESAVTPRPRKRGEPIS